jgi:aminopeptidase N
MARTDPHSYFDDAQPRTRHVEVAWRVDFARRLVEGRLTLHLEGGSGPLDLDTKGLAIASVTAGGTALPFALAEEEPVRGRRLRLELPAGAREVVIAYRTSPDSPALQWLEPAQTETGRHPFLFSQCQAIHARALAPLQDSPRARFSFAAEVEVPAPLTAVMSAGPAGRREGPGTNTFSFRMPQPIPPYLLALAVGEMEPRDLSPRSRVFAEPSLVERAAWEFAEIETMMATAEGLFGPYEWDRFDMLVLPPSFPYGGMENPRMTFLTPTIIAGDRSLVDVVSHELAHSWTGNLVTNATIDHFWLNEGFTVWADRRIQEALHGPEKAAFDWVIGGNGLKLALERFGEGSPLTRLRTDLAGQDPDDAYSQVPYEKGARLLAALERAVGRPRWDAFVRAYIDRFRFTSITTEEFMAFLDSRLPGASAEVDAARWLHEPGLPASSPVFSSPALERLAALAGGWERGERPGPEAAAWTPAELLVYLQRLPRALDGPGCAFLDAAFGLTRCSNYEVLVEWLTLAAASDHEPAFARLREVLGRVGRMKYLRPLYGALGHSPRTRALAREIFAAHGHRYHATSRRLVESVMASYPPE